MRRRHWSAAGIIGRHYSNDFLEKRDSNIFFTIPTYLVEIFWVRIVVRGGTKNSDQRQRKDYWVVGCIGVLCDIIYPPSCHSTLQHLMP